MARITAFLIIYFITGMAGAKIVPQEDPAILKKSAVAEKPSETEAQSPEGEAPEELLSAPVGSSQKNSSDVSLFDRGHTQIKPRSNYKTTRGQEMPTPDSQKAGGQ